MANESTAESGNEPVKTGQEKASGQQARSAGGPPQQQPAGRGAQQRTARRGAQEDTEGLSARRRYEPGALAIPAFAASPFSLMRRMIEDLDQLFDAFRSGAEGAEPEPRRPSLRGEAIWAPRVDMFEREGNLVVRADLPGLRKEDLRVDIEDGALVIEGERRQEREVEGAGVYRAERVYGTFRRVIPLPEGVDPETAEAHFDNGVLEVSLRMPEGARRKSIEIREGAQGSIH